MSSFKPWGETESMFRLGERETAGEMMKQPLWYTIVLPLENCMTFEFIEKY